MPKTGTVDLFFLIHSLTKAEKAYVKAYSIFTTKGNENALHLKFFDLLCRQKEYNEEKITSRLKITKSHLAFLKNHMYELILKILEFKHSESNPDAKLTHLLLRFDILLHKKLYAQCNKLINKIKSVATKNENILFLLYAVKKELDGFHNIKSREEIDKLHNTKRLLNKKLYYIIESNAFLDNASFIQSRKGFFRINERDKHFENIKINADKIFDRQETNKIIPYEAMKNYYSASATYHYYYLDFKNTKKYTGKLLDWIERHSKMITISPMEYSDVFRKMALISMSLNKFKQAYYYVNKLRTITCSDVDKKQIMKTSDDIELSVHIYTGNYTMAEKIVKRTELDNSKNLTWIYKASQTYFGTGDYNKSLLYINKILNTKKNTVRREDVYAFSKLFQVIIHYELGNYNLIEYLIRSNYRFLKKRGGECKFEFIILDFIGNKFNNINDRNDLIETFKKLKAKVDNILKDPHEIIALNYFDFIPWIESKIENRPFAEMVKKYRRAKNI